MMNQDELLQYLVEALENAGIEYIIVGAVASNAYGDPRLTRDIDIVVSIRPAHVSRLKAFFSESEFYFDEGMALNAIQRRQMFNIIHSSSGLKLDFIVKKEDAFADSQFQRRRHLPVFPDKSIYFASPEDVILAKMEFFKKGSSDKHLRDIASILKISGDTVDRAYITDWAEKLDLTDIWRAILQKLGEKKSR